MRSWILQMKPKNSGHLCMGCSKRAGHIMCVKASNSGLGFVTVCVRRAATQQQQGGGTLWLPVRCSCLQVGRQVGWLADTWCPGVMCCAVLYCAKAWCGLSTAAVLVDISMCLQCFATQMLCTALYCHLSPCVGPTLNVLGPPVGALT